VGWVRLNTKEKEGTFVVTGPYQEQPAVGAQLQGFCCAPHFE